MHKANIIGLTQILDDEEALLVVDKFGQLVRNAFAPSDRVPAHEDRVVPGRSPRDRDLLVSGAGLQGAGRIRNHRFVKVAVERLFRDPWRRRSAAVDSHGGDFDLKKCSDCVF